MDRRNSPRVSARVDALIYWEGRESAGVLGDLSYSGAVVEDCALRPPTGAKVRVYLYLPGEPTLELEAEVSRHTESGLALRYELHAVGNRRQLDAVMERVGPGARR